MESRTTKPLAAYLAALLLAAGILQQASAQLSQPPASRTTVAVVNCVPFHLEILLGTISTLRDLGYHTTVYSYLSPNPQGDRVRAAMALLHTSYGASNLVLHGCNELLDKPTLDEQAETRALVFVSGQEDAGFHAQTFDSAITLLRPRAVLAVVHNTRRHSLTASIMQHYKPAVLLALSERVHRKLAQHLPSTASTAWLLPTMPVGNGTLCLQPAAPCRTHFTIQGNIAPHRRNYSAVQASLEAQRSQLLSAGIMLKAVGAAEQQPQRPDSLAGLLEYHLNLGFHEFYDQVQQSLALIPAVASREYVDGTRITSTVVTALITGVPILADREFMAAYSFLPPTSFYEHLPHEELPAAMLRVAALPAGKHQDVRRSLLAARQRLQGHNMLALQEQLAHRA